MSAYAAGHGQGTDPRTIAAEQVDANTPLRIFQTSHNQSTMPQLIQVFLRADNVRWIIEQVESQLTLYAGQPVRLLVSMELCDTIARLASEKQSLPPSQGMLSAMNQTIIDKEVGVQRASISQQRRHHRYREEKTYLKVMPRARQQDEGAKWDQQTQHVVNHPVSKHMAAFNAFVRGK
jgi:hypothetical protein